MSSRWVYTLLFAVTFCAFFIAFLPFGGILKGVSADPQWTDGSSLFNGGTQRFLEVKYDSLLPGRAGLIRASNQIRYSAFNEINANLTQGKSGSLFEQTYLDEYANLNPLSKDSIESTMGILTRYKLRLENAGKKVLFVSIPSKTSFRQDLIPDEYPPSENTNSKQFLTALENAGFAVLDLKAPLQEGKRKTGYTVFPKYGIHWTHYGYSLAFQHFVETLDTLFPEVNMSVEIKNFVLSSSYDASDIDLWNVLNLWDSSPPMDDQIVHFEMNTYASGRLPKVLFIGDSFMWSWFANGLLNPLFDETYFSYYHHEIYWLGNGKINAPFPETISRIEDEVDLVVFFITEANMWRLPLKING